MKPDIGLRYRMDGMVSLHSATPRGAEFVEVNAEHFDRLPHDNAPAMPGDDAKAFVLHAAEDGLFACFVWD